MGNSGSKWGKEGYKYEYKGRSAFISIPHVYDTEEKCRRVMRAEEAKFRTRIDEELRIKVEQDAKTEKVRTKQAAFQETMAIIAAQQQQAEDERLAQRAEAERQQFMAIMQAFASNAQTSIASQESNVAKELQEVRKELQEFQQKNKELLEQLEEMKRKQQEAEEELNNIDSEQADIEQQLNEGEIDEEEARMRNAALEQRRQEAEARKEEATAAALITEQELAKAQQEEKKAQKNCGQQKKELDQKFNEHEQTRQELNQTARDYNVDYQIPEFKRELSNWSDISSLSGSWVPSIDTDWDLPNNAQIANNESLWKQYRPYLKWGGISLAIFFFLFWIIKKFISIF